MDTNSPKLDARIILFLNRETPKSKFQLIVMASVKTLKNLTLAFYLSNYIARLQIVRSIDADKGILGCQKLFNFDGCARIG